ncbi:hypothetical protein VNO80_09156 [Phaseolus coccineus]|uniref:WAT1-related protein n=1 Tax=Phaseolus coccineus TaxID=3886 RepID=A0AAN9NAY1_PHACN
MIRVFGNQLLYLIGLGYTNPTYAGAVQPTIPVFTFMFTLMIGLAGGTLICVSGAIFMVFYRDPAVIGDKTMNQVAQIKLSARGQPETSGWLINSLLDIGLDSFQLGVVFLIGNCLCMAAFLAIQAPVLKKYPANLSVTAYSFGFGFALMVIASYFMVNESADWILTQSQILAVAYSKMTCGFPASQILQHILDGGFYKFIQGTIASALNYGIITWSNKILGPTLVSLYNPLQPAFSAFLSQIFLGTPIFLGRGIFHHCGSIYIVIWASYRERQEISGVTPNGSRISEPLIHEKNEYQSGHSQGPPHQASGIGFGVGITVSTNERIQQPHLVF